MPTGTQPRGTSLSQPRRLATVLGLIAATVLGPVTAVASGEQPIEAHLVAPEGSELRTHPDGPLDDAHGSFLDGFEDLDVDRQGGAVGLVQRGDEAVLVTAVRLRDEDEAARALTAFTDGPLDDAVLELLPEVAPNTILVSELELGGGSTLVEVARATGRDLVVFAQLDLQQSGLTPYTREVVEAHLVAFPDVTPPAAARVDLGSWLLPLGLALGTAGTMLVVVMLLRRRKRRRSIAPPSIESNGGRVIW